MFRKQLVVLRYVSAVEICKTKVKQYVEQVRKLRNRKIQPV